MGCDRGYRWFDGSFLYHQCTGTCSSYCCHPPRLHAFALISVIGFLIYGEAFELPILLGAGIIFIAILLNLKAEKERQSELA